MVDTDKNKAGDEPKTIPDPKPAKPEKDAQKQEGQSLDAEPGPVRKPPND